MSFDPSESDPPVHVNGREKHERDEFFLCAGRAQRSRVFAFSVSAVHTTETASLARK